MGCDCGRLRRENDELRRRLEEYETGSDEFDDEDYDEEEDISDMSDRFDEPSAPAPDSSDLRRGAGRPGGRLGDAHVKDVGKAYLRYNQAVSRGQTYGSDIWRYSAGRRVEGESPIERGMAAVTRLNRSRWH
jgi:hypothetical protein